MLLDIIPQQIMFLWQYKENLYSSWQFYMYSFQDTETCILRRSAVINLI